MSSSLVGVDTFGDPILDGDVVASNDYSKTIFYSPRALHFVAAGASAAVSCATYNPLDCLRVRWQVAPPLASTGLVSYGWHIVRTEGLVEGLWKPGLGPNVVGMAISAAIRFGYYETVRDALSGNSTDHWQSDETKKKSGTHMLAAGLICGSVGYLATTPFHLLKTMIQAERGLIGTDGRYLSGSRMGKEPFAPYFFSGVERIIYEQGLSSLWRGAMPLMSRGALFTAGQMLGYDGFKTIARRNGFEDGPILHIVSSVSASFGASFLSAPADLVMAVYMTDSQKQGLYQCVRGIYKKNGIPGFWRGWPIFFFRLTPVMLTCSTLYEQLRFQFGLGYLT